MSESEKDGGFKVTDKRIFTSEGEIRSDVEDSEPKAVPAEPSPTGGSPSASQEPFQMTFETLVMSLSSTAMVQLGVIADPINNQVAQNLPAAKQTIDILEILQQKTKGNLDNSESKLLDNILYELRMIYLELSQSIKVPR